MVAENITPQTNVSGMSELNKFTVKSELLSTVLQIQDPTVRVLFRWEKEVDYSNGAADDTTGQEPLPCVKLIVNYEDRELSSACRMQGGVLACVVRLPIPVDWWSTMSETDSLKAYYSVFEVAENAPCLPDNQNAIPPRDGEPGQATASPDYFVGEIKMGSSYDGFSVNREDQYVWIHAPTAEFGSNAKFQIPVSILSNFTATGCVIRWVVNFFDVPLFKHASFTFVQYNPHTCKVTGLMQPSMGTLRAHPPQESSKIRRHLDVESLGVWIWNWWIFTIKWCGHWTYASVNGYCKLTLLKGQRFNAISMYLGV